MNVHLTRKMNKEDAATWASWFKTTQNLEPFKDLLTKKVADNMEDSDNIAIYQGPAAASELAYRAGYRAALREAVALLTCRA